MQLVEEVLDDSQLTGAGNLVVDELADGEIEDAETERGEHHRPLRGHHHTAGHHVVQRAAQEVTIAGELFGQVRRRVGLHAVVDVVEDVGRPKQDLRREVAKRHVQYHWIVVKPRRFSDVWLARHGGKHQHVAGADHVFGSVKHGYPAGDVRTLQITSEARGAVGRKVVDADLVKCPPGGGHERVDIARDQPGTDEPDAPWVSPAAAEPVRSERRRSRRPGRTDDRAFETRKRVPGVVVVQDEHGRRSGHPSGNVLREARDPLQPVDPNVPTNGGWQRNDPGRWTIQKAQEVRGRVHRLAGAVQAVRCLDQRDDLLLAPVQHLLDLSARDHPELRYGEPTNRGWLPGAGFDRGHAVVTSPVGTYPSRTGSAMPTSTSRGPSYGSRLCAVRMLSTSIRSPACHGSRAVFASYNSLSSKMVSSEMGSPFPKRVLNGSPSSPYMSTRYSRISGAIVHSLRNAIWLNQHRSPVIG